MRITLAGLFLFLLLGKVVWAQTEKSPVAVEALVREALERNPDLQAAYRGWQASEAIIPAEGSLPDPVLGFNLLNLPVNSFAFNQEPMTGKQITLMQKIPFPGKLGLKTDIARVQSQMNEASFREAQNRLVYQVKQLYYELFYLDRALEVIEHNRELLNQFRKLAETKYSVGSGLQQDILKIQVELLKLEEKFISLSQKRNALNLRLNALLNRSNQIKTVPFPRLPVPEFTVEADSLLAIAREHRPLLRAWELATRKSEKQVALAKKNYFPDFTIGVTYTQRERLTNGYGGVDFFSATFNINIPLYFWRKQRKQVEQQSFRIEQNQWKYRDVLKQVESEIAVVYDDLQRNLKLLQLYHQGILPQGTQSLQSNLSAYRTDKVDFLTLLNSQMTLFNDERDYYRVLSHAYQNLARLAYLTGKEFRVEKE